MREQRLEFGAEYQLSVGQQCVVHRLDAEAIARKEDRLAVPVVEGKGEHPAEPLDAALAPGFPRMHDDLGVASWSGTDDPVL